MWKHIGPAGLALLTLNSVFVTVLGVASKQEDIDAIANDLKLEILVGTNHEAVGNYDLTFVLTNNGTKRILDKSDWFIMFSLKDRNLLLNPMYEIYGLRIVPAEGCLYVITPSPAASTPFPGINPEEGFTFTIEADGLSMFRTDFYPRFSVYSDNTSPRTIRLTDDDDLRFIRLIPANDSFTDTSKMTGIRRSLTQPDIQDRGRVAPTIVIPAPKEIDRMTDNLIDLSTTQQWYIWPDAQVSEDFKNLFVQKIKSAPNVTHVQFTFVTSEPPAGADRVYLQIAPDPTKTDDAYILDIKPRLGRRRNFNKIHIKAPTNLGLNHALESLMGILGLYNMMPEITITDDARFAMRSLRLDVTKNFVPTETVIKLLNLMKMYKLNNLILKLADDHGWRLGLGTATMDFPELWTFASQRCIDQTTCIPPSHGSGSGTSTSGSGYYTIDNFTAILQHARSLFITVTPKFNFLGGIRTAKLASHVRYERLINLRPADADNLHLMSLEPVLTEAEIPEDVCYVDGILDPCNEATYTFMNETIRVVAHIYSAANVPFGEFHAGGDALTQFFGRFPSCIGQNVDQVAAMSRMLHLLQRFLSPFNAKLRVDEEAVISPTTGTCIPPTGNQFDGTQMTVDFWNLMPGSHLDWDLTPEQWAFIDAPVQPPEMPADGMGPAVPISEPDPVLPYTGARKGMAPWSKAYNCANQGYKVVLAPENFFSLDSPYELDFYEPGNRHKRRFHVINLHRMMMFEPFNLNINQDLGNDRYTYLPYRLCKVFQCETLTDVGRANILGLEATLDTSIVRNEARLWYMLLPRLVLYAEKCWKRAPFEDLVMAEEPTTLLNMSNVQLRAFHLNTEMMHFINNLGHKEAGRLDDASYQYRVARPGASIYFGLSFRAKPPYPVVVKVGLPGSDLEYLESTPGAKWKALFTRDDERGIITGGYNFSFPISNQKIQIRAKSANGKRSSIPTLLTASSYNLFPRDIPLELREDACLPIAEGWRTNLEDISLEQWNKLLNNIDAVTRDEETFIQRRMQNLTAVLTSHNSRSRTNFTLPQVFMNIEASLAQGQNISTFPDANVIKKIFTRDMRISENRGRSIEQRFDRWEARYQTCRNKKAGGAGNSGRRPQQTAGGARGQARGGGRGQARGQGQNQQRGQARGQSRNQRTGQARGRTGTRGRGQASSGASRRQ